MALEGVLITQAIIGLSAYRPFLAGLLSNIHINTTLGYQCDRDRYDKIENYKGRKATTWYFHLHG